MHCMSYIDNGKITNYMERNNHFAAQQMHRKLLHHTSSVRFQESKVLQGPVRSGILTDITLSLNMDVVMDVLCVL